MIVPNFLGRRGYNYVDEFYDEYGARYDYYYLNTDNSINSNSLEYLISTPQIINTPGDQEEKKKKLTLIDFQDKNLNKLKEDLILYFSSPESLAHFKTSLDEETKYDFYKDLDCENFIIAQIERFKKILLISDSDNNSQAQMKKSTLSNFNNSFCIKASLIQDRDPTHQKLLNVKLLGEKIEESSFLFSQQDLDENKIISYLNELKDIFVTKVIDMESLGLLHFSSIEKNLFFILRMIERIFLLKDDKKCLTNFCLICLDILKGFKSNKLYFYIMQLLKQYKDKLDLTKINENKEIIHFIPNNCFDFGNLSFNINKVLIKDLRKPLIDKNIIKNDSNELQINLNDYRVVNYDDYLLIFIGSKYNMKENSKENIYYYYKVDLLSQNVIDVGKINLLNEEEEKSKNLKIIDINISLNKEYIYIFYIIEDSEKYCLKCKIYDKYSLELLEEKIINLEKDFIPKRLFNDNKNLYCISDAKKLLMVKKNKKLDCLKFINCSLRLFEKELIYFREINDLLSFEMYNALYIHNLFIINDINTKKKYIARLVTNKKEEYILNLYEMTGKPENDALIKITYNENRFIITKIYRGDNRIYYDITSKYSNNLMDKGISLLPFNSNNSNYVYPDNLFEYLIQEYSSFLNLFGNFDLVNKEKVASIINNPFPFCFNFDPNNLQFIIECVIENDVIDNMKLNYIIILKQIICSLYNSELLKEELIKDIIPYFKKLILKSIDSKENKLFNKILKEIIVITTYIKKNTIFEIDEIKFALNKDFKNINTKSKFLLIELLLKQNEMKDSKGLYELIIQLEKEVLSTIFKSDSFDLSDYYSSQNLMIKASESFYKRLKFIKEELLSLIPCLLENIEALVELKHKKPEDKNIIGCFPLYNSFIFRSFYLILEYLIANKIILGKKEYIIQIYKTLLLMDKNNINFNDSFDMDNIVEITNYSFFNDIRNDNYYGRRNSMEVKINLKESKNIIIKTNIISNRELYHSIIIDIKKDNKIIPVNFSKEKNVIYHDVKEIDVIFENYDRNINDKDFIINIIPIKNENLFNLYKNDKDLKIISLIEKSIIQYLLYLFEDINSQIEKYNNEKIVKSHLKIFQSEIFKFLSVPMNEKANNNKGLSKFNEVTSKLLEKLNKILININDFNILNNELLSNFNKVNKEIHQNIFDFQKVYEERLKNNNNLYNQNSINSIDETKYEILFKIYNHELSKKNLLINQITKNDNLYLLIKKIFLFGIKYYNCYDKLNNLMKKIKKKKIEDKDDIKKNIEEIKDLDNFSLFHSFYEESVKMNDIYRIHKNQFNDSKYDEENKKYFEENLKKVDFLYNNIIPCDDFTIKPNTSIIKNLIEIMEYYDIGIYEVIQYSRVQNISSQIKLIELSIINNLLLYLKNESNINLILNFICKKMRHSYNILNSIFDNTFGADYFDIEKLKQQFHLFLHILSYKLINNKNNYSNITKISLVESLIWKIKKRNFPILFEIMKVFEEIKTAKKNNYNDFLFKFNSDNIYNVNYYNSRKALECKFEVFKIIVYQIMNIMNDFLKYKNENENQLTLERTPSSLLEIDFKKIFKNIMSYFTDINEDCIYFNELILYFYKIFINYDILLSYILQEEPNVIKKIVAISFNKEFKNNNEINTKLIMIKLLIKIIENTQDDNLNDLSRSLQNIEKSNLIIQNPFLYLYEIILKDFNSINPKKEKAPSTNIEISNICKKCGSQDNYYDEEYGELICFNCRNVLKINEILIDSGKKSFEDNEIIHKYYIDLLFLCINRISESEKEEKILNEIFNNKNLWNLMLLENNKQYISENKFFVKENNSNYSIFENIALFNSQNKKSTKSGKIICFLEDKLNTYLNSNHERNQDNLANTFDKNSFLYESNLINNKYNNALVIMEDFEQLDYYNITNVETKKISQIEIIKTDNKYKKIFIQKNSKLILNAIKEELIDDKLNEKGIYLILKIISLIKDYIKNEEIKFIFEYLWKLYNKIKLEEDNYPFMSLEYVEKEINNYFQLNNIKNIHKEIQEQNESLFSFFDFSIKDNILEVNRNIEIMNKTFNSNLNIPNNIKKIIETNDNIRQIYKESYKVSNLSFNIFEENISYEIINDNSILFYKPISTDNDLSDLTKMIENNKNKMKAIIVNKVEQNINQNNLTNFLITNKIPIYELEKSVFQKFVDFFFKGISLNYIYLYNNNSSNQNLRSANDDAFCFLKLNIEKISEEKKMEDIISNMPQDKLNNIKTNPRYKSEICEHFLFGQCLLRNRCNLAHGEKELEEIKNIRNYLNKRKENKEKINNDLNNKDAIEDNKNKYKNNRMEVLAELKDETKNILDILNIKLSKRLIFDILSIEMFEQKNIFDDTIYIYETLCLEYYFNILHNISNNGLREKLLITLEKFTNDKDILPTNNKWILYFFKQMEKIDSKQQEFYLENFRVTNKNNESKLLNIYYYNPTILYDKILFLIEIMNKENKNEYFINYYINIISSVLNNIVNKIENIKKSQNDTQESSGCLILSMVINIIYNHYYKILSNNESDKKKFEKVNIPNNIDEAIQKLYKLNLDEYFSKNNNNNIRDNYRKKMTKQMAFLIEFIFKYFDLYLLLLYKDNQIKFFDYMVNVDNLLFARYKSYKILTLEESNTNEDYKESFALIYYIMGLNLSKVDVSIKENVNTNDKDEEKHKSNKEIYKLENLKKAYTSDELIQFIELFKKLTEKNIKALIKSFESLKMGKLKTIDIDFNEFISYINNNGELKDLLFFKNTNNEVKIFFNYLKARIALIEDNIRNYFYMNNSLKSEGFIKKIIERNLIYLNDDFRVQYFLTILLNMIYEDNYYYNNIRDYYPNRRYNRYDDNREVLIDRIKSLNFKEKFNENKIPDIYLNETIFGQLFHSLGDLNGKKFLKEKGKKLFKVNLKGEGAIDAGGPYSEVISDICDDLQSDYIELFIKTPNNKYNVGELRDRYIINPNCDNITYKKAYEFIGKMMALAISSGETLNFNLHPIFWKSLLNNKISFKEYETIDKNFYNTIEQVKEGKKIKV